MNIFLKTLGVGAMIVGMTGCAGLSEKPDTPEQRQQALQENAQQQRETTLKGMPYWQWQAQVAWFQDQDTDGQAVLSWKEEPKQRGVKIKFLDERFFGEFIEIQEQAYMKIGQQEWEDSPANLNQLLQNQWGETITLEQLLAWIKGMRATEEGKVWLNPSNGLPMVIQENGWTIKYLYWYNSSIPLPASITLFNEQHQVMVIALSDWVVNKTKKTSN